LGVETTHTCTNVLVANLATLEARTVQLETARSNTVAGNFARWKLVKWVAKTSRCEGTGVAGEDASNSSCACAIDSALGDCVLAIKTTASTGIASTACFETVAIECYAL
jgi:hypothetical protein